MTDTELKLMTNAAIIGNSSEGLSFFDILNTDFFILIQKINNLKWHQIQFPYRYRNAL